MITGICVRKAEEVGARLGGDQGVVRGHVGREISEYVASGEPMDKAGAYAIQGLASKFIERIDGSYANVVGLPVALVYKHLQKPARSPL